MNDQMLQKSILRVIMEKESKLDSESTGDYFKH